MKIVRGKIIWCYIKQKPTVEMAVVFSLSCLADNVEIWYNLHMIKFISTDVKIKLPNFTIFVIFIGADCWVINRFLNLLYERGTVLCS